MARLALLSAVLASLLAPAVAAAELRAMGTLRGPVETDGERWAAWSTRAGVIRVVDTVRGSSFDVRANCSLVAVDGGQVLLSCFEQGAGLARNAPWLIDVRTRELRRVGAFDGLLATFGPIPTVRTYPRAVGRHWVTVAVQGDKGSHDAYLNWRSGELIDRPATPAATLVRDLDARHALRRLCRPLRRRFPGRRSELYVYDRPWALRESAGGRGLELRRCGSGDRVSVGSCESFCRSPQLGGGLVTWGVERRSRRDAVHAFGIRARRRVTIGRVPRAAPTSNVRVAHTRTRVRQRRLDRPRLRRPRRQAAALMARCAILAAVTAALALSLAPPSASAAFGPGAGRESDAEGSAALTTYTVANRALP